MKKLLTKLKLLFTKVDAPKRLNTFDIDGVIYINKEVGGVHPGPNDIIITGRSYEEKPETLEMLRKRKIFNKVYFNGRSFDDKTRRSSGVHKACVIKKLQSENIEVMCHFEDDEVQAEVIKIMCPDVNVVMIQHNLTNKENVRHKE